ncbi:MAG TPA: hypothetical protein ENK02_16140 [Planctomycetes bacterium]|nr:hypothetical protein [Planctomycetota bacterium]
MEIRRSKRAGGANLVSILLLLLVPAVLLFPSLFGNRDYVPFDLSTFPPWSVGLESQVLEARRQGGNYDITEKTVLCAQEYRLAREEIVDGVFPHWDPYVRAGGPLFANALNGFVYPTHWLFFLTSPEKAFGLAAWVAFAMAGLFCYFFLRAVGLGVLGALCGGLVFQLSGTLVANGHFFMRMETLAWLPAGFWALLSLQRREGAERIPAFVGFALTLCMTWLAGFPPFAASCSMAFGLYALALGVRTLRQQGKGEALAYSLWTGGAIAVGLLLPMVQLLPMLDYFPESQRDLHQSLASLLSQGLDPMGWLDFLFPALFGDGTITQLLPYDRNPFFYLGWTRTHPETGKLFFPPNFVYTEYALYFGAFPLLAAFAALVRPSFRIRRFAFLALLGFLLLSSGGFLFKLFASLPVFQSFPPMRFAGPVCFFAAILAGIGFDLNLQRMKRSRKVFCLSVGSLLFLFALAVYLWSSWALEDPKGRTGWVLEGIAHRWAGNLSSGDPLEMARNILGPYFPASLLRLKESSLHAALFLLLGLLWFALRCRKNLRQGGAFYSSLSLAAPLLIILDLFPLAHRLNPTFPHRELPDTTVHRFLRDRAMASKEQGGFMVARVSHKAGAPIALPPNLLIPLGIRDLNAYAFLDAWSHKPFLKMYGKGQMIRNFWLKSLPADERLGYGIFDLFGVRYLLSTEEIEELGPGATPPLEGPGGKFFIYERKTALPRAFFVENPELVSDEEALDRLTSSEFDPRASLLLSHPYGVDGLRAPRPEKLPEQRTREKRGEPRIHFLSDHPSAIKILVENSPGGWLLLSDVAMSHWKAHLNGQTVPWWRADLCFRAIQVPPGDHEVLWTYDPGPFLHGLWLSAFSLASLLILLLWWNGRKSSGEEEEVGTTTLSS